MPAVKTSAGSNLKVKRADFQSLQGQDHDIWNNGILRGSSNNVTDFLINSSNTTNNPSMTYNLTSALDYKG